MLRCRVQAVSGVPDGRHRVGVEAVGFRGLFVSPAGVRGSTGLRVSGFRLAASAIFRLRSPHRGRP